MMNICRIKETCLYVKDLEQTKSFYTTILELPVISSVPNRHVFFRAGESVLLCFIAEKTVQETILPPHGANGQIHFAFEVPQSGYNNAREKIAAHSIPILHNHVWPNGKHSFYFHDPDKHLVEIIEEGLWDK